VKTIVGTSGNAVRIQVWTALIAMLLLKFLQLRSTFGWSLSNLVALLRQQLFVYRNLWTWINGWRGACAAAPRAPSRVNAADASSSFFLVAVFLS
jgi:hypothetical protein